MNLNNYFDKIYCINLDRRTDRWEKCKEQFDKLGIEVERFSAVDGNTENHGLGHPFDSELAGAISHTRVIEKAKQLGLKNVLVLEDDVVFHDDVQELFEKYAKQLPKDWDGVLFGGNHVAPTTFENRNIVKLQRSYALHAYAINAKAYDPITNYMNSQIDESIKRGKGKSGISIAADFFMANLQPSNKWYCFKPHLAWQAEDFSDIQNSTASQSPPNRYSEIPVSSKLSKLPIAYHSPPSYIPLYLDWKIAIGYRSYLGSNITLKSIPNGLNSFITQIPS
jgi:GR25 family glycosyltransferase involved in LPS biosynthesis